ncbi:MAG: thiamine pyrophosphate-binding protein [Acidobacteria bacterium]|nr:thiamine pyrophosphate-binding protein [Acidobacteriota bacterium]
MRELVRDLMNAQLTRRGFVGAMVSAGYTAAAARAALQSVAPFTQGAAATAASASMSRVMEGTCGEILTEQLIETGTKYFFVSNGSGIGPVCDALVTRPQIQLIQATHEGQVVAIADGYAKATRKPAFGMFSRVGMMNASSNMYNAMKDRTPVVLFSDHADTGSEGRDGGEDLDEWIESVRPYTKWRWVLHEAARIAEIARNATKIASVMPYGPAYVRIPRNLFYREKLRATIFTGKAFDIPMQLAAGEKDVEAAAKLLLDSTSPLLVTGFEVTQCGAQGSLVKLAEMLGMPVLLGRGYGMDFPSAHPLCIGEPDRLRFPKKVDCVLNIGLPAFPGGLGGARGTTMIHATTDPEAIGRNTPLDAALLGNLDVIAKQLIEAVKSLATPAQIEAKAATRRAEISKFTASTRKARLDMARKAEGSPIPWYRLMAELEQLAEPDAVIVPELGDDGRFSSFFNFAPDARWKIGRTRGQALGWGVGAAAGVKLALPDRQVISIQGDGGFLFGQTDVLWTLSRYSIPLLVVILNNGSYEATRWRIMARDTAAGKAGRDYISHLGNPDVDFKGLAASYNVPSETVRNTTDLRPAILKAFKTMKDGRPYLLDVRVKTTGTGAGASWYPQYSLAAQRTKNV